MADDAGPSDEFDEDDAGLPIPVVPADGGAVNAAGGTGGSGAAGGGGHGAHGRGGPGGHRGPGAHGGESWDGEGGPVPYEPSPYDTGSYTIEEYDAYARAIPRMPRHGRGRRIARRGLEPEPGELPDAAGSVGLTRSVDPTGSAVTARPDGYAETTEPAPSAEPAPSGERGAPAGFGEAEGSGQAYDRSGLHRTPVQGPSDPASVPPTGKRRRRHAGPQPDEPATLSESLPAEFDDELPAFPSIPPSPSGQALEGGAVGFAGSGASSPDETGAFSWAASPYDSQALPTWPYPSNPWPYPSNPSNPSNPSSSSTEPNASTEPSVSAPSVSTPGAFAVGEPDATDRRRAGEYVVEPSLSAGRTDEPFLGDEPTWQAYALNTPNTPNAPSATDRSAEPTGGDRNRDPASAFEAMEPATGSFGQLGHSSDLLGGPDPLDLPAVEPPGGFELAGGLGDRYVEPFDPADPLGDAVPSSLGASPEPAWPRAREPWELDAMRDGRDGTPEPRPAELDRPEFVQPDRALDAARAADPAAEAEAVRAAGRPDRFAEPRDRLADGRGDPRADPRDGDPRPDGRDRGGDPRAVNRGASAQTGMPAWVAVLVSLLSTGAAATLDLALTRSIGLFFGLCFVLTAFGVAAGVRRDGVFTASVLPPLSALGSFLAIGFAAPERLGSQDPIRAALGGLAASAWFIVAATAVALGTAAFRVAFAPRPRGSNDAPADPSAYGRDRPRGRDNARGPRRPAPRDRAPRRPSPNGRPRGAPNRPRTRR